MMKSKNRDRDHLNLLCDIGELANLIIGSTDIQGFLQQTVEMVARHLDADVGSIYLLLIPRLCWRNPHWKGSKSCYILFQNNILFQPQDISVSLILF